MKKIQDNAVESSLNLSFFKTKFFFISLIFFLVALLPSLYFYNQYQKTLKLLKNPTAITEQEKNDLVEKVGKIFQLPKGDPPTIATVSDKNKLKSQAFFLNSENGDKVLIFPKVKRAILYRPSTNQIIEVMPVNMDGNVAGVTSNSLVPTNPTVIVPTASVSATVTPKSITQTLSLTPSPTKTTPVKISIYNGTKIMGLAKVVEKQIKEKISDIEVIGRDNARNDYTETLVIDLTGNSSDLSKKLAEILEGKVSEFPDGEQKPEADILIIAGQ